LEESKTAFSQAQDNLKKEESELTDQLEPTTKREILDLIEAEKSHLEAALGKLTQDQMLAADLEGRRSVKDILAHITAWEMKMIQWINESLAGSMPQRPAPDEPWTDLDELNEQIYQANKDWMLNDILAAYDTAYEKSLELIQSMSHEDLFDGERFAWRHADPMWRMVAANTWEHYKEHREQIEAWLGERA
jgi:hypothetical protein